jgi:hypothetical protein
VKTTPDLKLQGVAFIDGLALACGWCENTFSLEAHKQGLFETGPAWMSCLSCGRGGEHPKITNGLIDAVLTGWAQRQKSADRDTFTAEWRGTVLAGQLVPTLDIYQAIGAYQAAHKAVAPEVKRWWRGKKRHAKRTVKGKVKGTLRKARGHAEDGVDTAKAAALTAAWNLQTGGAGPTTKRRGRRCTVKGCRKGWLTIKTRMHSTNGRTQQRKIRCAMCARADA